MVNVGGTPKWLSFKYVNCLTFVMVVESLRMCGEVARITNQILMILTYNMVRGCRDCQYGGGDGEWRMNTRRKRDDYSS